MPTTPSSSPILGRRDSPPSYQKSLKPNYPPPRYADVMPVLAPDAGQIGAITVQPVATLVVARPPDPPSPNDVIVKYGKFTLNREECEKIAFVGILGGTVLAVAGGGAIACNPEAGAPIAALAVPLCISGFGSAAALRGQCIDW